MLLRTRKCVSCFALLSASLLPSLAVEFTATAQQSGAEGSNNLPLTAQPFDFSNYSLDIDEITSMTITLTMDGGYTAPNEQGSEGMDVDQIVLMLDDIPTELRLNGFPGPTTRLSFDFVPDNAAEILMELQKDSALRATIVDLIPGNNHMHFPGQMAVLTIRGRSTREPQFSVASLALMLFIGIGCVALLRKSRTTLLMVLTAAAVASVAQGPPDVFWTAGGHGGNIYSISVSPDSQYAATASDDGIARISRLSDGSLTSVFRAHGNVLLKGIVYSPNGETAISGGADQKARIWKVSDGTIIHTLTGHTGTVHAVAFSRDGQFAFTASEDGTAKIWRASDGTLVRTLTGHAGAVRALACSPNGQLLATASADRNAKVWRISDGSLVQTFVGSFHWLNCVDFSPDNSMLATGGIDTRVRLWRISDGSRILSFTGHGSDVNAVKFLPGGQLIASGGKDQRVRVWRVADGVEVIALDTPGWVFSLALLKDPNRIMVGDGAGLHIYNRVTGNLIRTVSGHAGAATVSALSPDGRLLATGGADRTVRLWRLSDGMQLQVLRGPISAISSIAWSPDGTHIAVGCGETYNRYDYKIRIWRVDDGTLVRTLLGHTNYVRSVAYSPDGSLLVSSSSDLTWKLWNAATGDLVRTIVGHTGGVYSVAFSPDGQSIASGSYDYNSKLWRTVDGELLRTFSEHDFLVRSVAFNPSGTALASGSSDGTIHLSEIASGSLLDTLTGHTGPVRSVTFTPDGGFVVSGSEDLTVKVWDAASRSLLHDYNDGSAAAIYSVSASPNGGIFSYSRGEGSVPVAGSFVKSTYNATSFTISKGTLQGGNLASLISSDDNRLLVQAAAPINLLDPSAQVVVHGLAGPQDPAVLGFEIESSCTGTPSSKALLRVELFNFTNGLWTIVDERQPTFADSMFMRAILVDCGDYIDDKDKTVRARISWYDSGVASLSWSGRIDRWTWVGRN